jgi:hypothetical protein
MTEDGFPPKLKRAAISAVSAVVMNDQDQLNQALRACAKFGERGMACAMWLWAQIAQALWLGTDQEPPPGAFWGFQTVGEDAEPIDPGTITGPGRGALWALRFLMATANRDNDQALALYLSVRQGSFRDDGPWDLLQMAASLAREHLEEIEA